MCTGLENKAIKMNFLSYEIIKKQRKYFNGTLKGNDQNCNDVHCMLQQQHTRRLEARLENLQCLPQTFF